jgi:hypothetical protein
MAQGRITEAGNILAALKSKEATPEDEDVVLLRRQIETSIEIESAGGPFQYKELLVGGKIQNFRRLILCGLVNLMQQFTGTAHWYARKGKRTADM